MDADLHKLLGLLDGLDLPAQVRAQVQLLREPRYTDRRPLTHGGMGEVSRVMDRHLNRVVAEKVPLQELLLRSGGRERFQQEVQITARLEHPAIVPVHDAGQWEDGRPYFTMRLVRGEGDKARTLLDVMRDVWKAARSGSWSSSHAGWSLHRLMMLYARVCDAVAYAHSEQVVHLDLKPKNILVGAYGEVMIIDWGLARRLDEPADRVGRPGGTWSYMSPEQADLNPTLSPASDVYALGAILFHLLAGEPPFRAAGWTEVRDRLRARRLPVVPTHLRFDLPADETEYRSMVADDWDEDPPPPLPIPEELRALCMRAMRVGDEPPFARAEELGAAVEAWLDGSRRRQEALKLVEQARAAENELKDLRTEALQLRARARTILTPLKPWASVEEKLPGWRLEGQATEKEAESARQEVEYLRLLHAAILGVPDLPEARALLGRHYLAERSRALDARDPAAAAAAEALLRVYGPDQIAAEALPQVSIATAVEGAHVRVLRFVEGEDRLLRPEVLVHEGSLPLVDLPLPRGSYLATIEVSGRPPVRYPFVLQREETWAALPPGEASARPVLLPKTLAEDERFVPAGWMWCGGPPQVPAAGRWTRVWVDDVIVRADPVTNQQYIAFLDELVSQGREDEALRHAPAIIGGRVLYGRTKTGGFCLIPDEDGDLWEPDWPVVHVSWHGARAYAAWEAARTGLPWRLPLELEWEKAARGVDGRRFPWGEHFDPTWCCGRDSAERAMPVAVDSPLEDVSVYGVRGMAGNVREWCLDPWRPEGPWIVDQRAGAPFVEGAERRALRGGSWNGGPNYAQCAARDGDSSVSRKSYIGFRLVRTP